MKKPLRLACWTLAALSAGSLDCIESVATPEVVAATVDGGVMPTEPVMPNYKPRKDHAPRARVGSSLRGSDPQQPTVIALVPDHVGFTIKSDPSLCWFLSQRTALPVTLTMLDSRTIRPLLETTLPSSLAGGVHCVHLSDYRLTLREREQYRWFIAIVLNPDQPSRDIVSGGMIERIPFDEGCVLGLPCSGGCRREAVYRYAESGLWYDAISCLHQLIETAPDDSFLTKMLQNLLSQSDISLPSTHDLAP